MGIVWIIVGYWMMDFDGLLQYLMPILTGTTIVSSVWGSTNPVPLKLKYFLGTFGLVLYLFILGSGMRGI